MSSIKVSSKSKTKEVAEAIISSLEEGKVSLDCIGAGAINQAIKAIAVLNATETRFTCIPHFFSTVINGEEKSGIKLCVEEEN